MEDRGKILKMYFYMQNVYNVIKSMKIRHTVKLKLANSTAASLNQR